MKNLSVNRHSNNFDIIRFFAAFLVIIKHSNALTGEDHYFISDQNLPFLGVPIFFIISGYLITISAIRSNNMFTYLWKRILRIIPGLAIATLFTVVIIGPLVSNTPIFEYFLNPETYNHLLSITLYKFKNSIPSVFEENLISGVNGSLWTLKYEFTCYILVLILVVSNAHKLRHLILAMFVLIVSCRIYMGDDFYIYDYRNKYALGHNLMYLVQWGVYFLSGVVFYLFKEKIPLKGNIALIATLIYAMLFYFYPETIKYYQYVYIPYCLFYISFIPGKTNHFGKYGDFSYGMYIYAFPVQQTLIHFSDSIHPLVLTGYTTVLVLGLSFLSWNYVEKPMLRLKNLFEKKSLQFSKN
ncbi:MAG: hypothetical protein CMP67_04410 [Flavobacteriales bacterium]|nr:hypothetical protein [Flavobacteriales bacterium]MBO72267.1 hypothetical protein [Flavobacteriales bacterium]|tara:strand:- start:285 stop:1349 length:1065 start_codon:yes stop_codon:yes gene_type:complete